MPAKATALQNAHSPFEAQGKQEWLCHDNAMLA
jgi:hypothetical protein